MRLSDIVSCAYCGSLCSFTVSSYHDPEGRPIVITLDLADCQRDWVIGFLPVAAESQGFGTSTGDPHICEIASSWRMTPNLRAEYAACWPARPRPLQALAQPAPGVAETTEPLSRRTAGLTSVLLSILKWQPRLVPWRFVIACHRAAGEHAPDGRYTVVPTGYVMQWAFARKTLSVFLDRNDNGRINIYQNEPGVHQSRERVSRERLAREVGAGLRWLYDSP